MPKRATVTAAGVADARQELWEEEEEEVLRLLRGGEAGKVGRGILSC